MARKAAVKLLAVAIFVICLPATAIAGDTGAWLLERCKSDRSFCRGYVWGIANFTVWMEETQTARKLCLPAPFNPDPTLTRLAEKSNIAGWDGVPALALVFQVFLELYPCAAE